MSWTTSLRRAATALSMIGTLGACKEGPPLTATSFEPTAPEVAEVLYPAREGSLLRHEALSHLPADTSWVVVADLPALLSLSPFGDLLGADTEPYDKLIEAASVHAAGMVLGREVEHLKSAGLDLTSPWGMASVEGRLILFGKVADPKALVARVLARAKAEDHDVHNSELGTGPLLQIDETHAIWLDDGLVYLIEASYGRAKETVKRLAATPKDKSLASQPHFVKARDRVRFGDHAAAYVDVSEEVQTLTLKYDVAHLERRYEELEEWLGKQRDSSEPLDAETTDKIAEIEARLRHKDAEMARLKDRHERVEALPEALGFAIGFELHAATLRGKAHLPLPKALAADLFGDAALPPAPSAAHEDASGVDPVATVSHWELPLSPAGALELAQRTVGNTRSRALYRWLGGDAPPKSDPLLPLLSGAVARSYHAVDNARHVRLELGIVPDAAATLRGWLERVDTKAADTPIERHGDRLHLAAVNGSELWIEVRDGSVVLAGHERLLDARPSHIAAEDPELLTALGLLSSTNGSLSLPAAAFIPSSGGMFASRVEMISSPMLGLLGTSGTRFGSSSSKKELDEERKKLEKKRKRLEKRRAEVRGDLATLRSRHRVEARSGRSRLLTALGTSVARVHPEPEGVTFYFAQRIAETDMAALSEHVVYALVDSSSESETAQQIRELEDKLEELDEQLRELPSLAVVSVLGDAGVLDSVLMAPSSAAAFGSSGIGSSGIGSSGIGGLGTKGTVGSGSGYGKLSTGKVSAGGGGKVSKP